MKDLLLSVRRRERAEQDAREDVVQGEGESLT